MAFVMPWFNSSSSCITAGVRPTTPTASYTHTHACKHTKTHTNISPLWGMQRNANPCSSPLSSPLFVSFSSLHNTTAGSLPPSALIGNFSWCVYASMCAKPSSISIVDSLATARLLLQFVCSINPQWMAADTKAEGKGGIQCREFPVLFPWDVQTQPRVICEIVGGS